MGVLVVGGGGQGDTERLCSEHIIAIDKLKHYKFVFIYHFRINSLKKRLTVTELQ